MPNERQEALRRIRELRQGLLDNPPEGEYRSDAR